MAYGAAGAGAMAGERTATWRHLHPCRIKDAGRAERIASARKNGGGGVTRPSWRNGGQALGKTRSA